MKTNIENVAIEYFRDIKGYEGCYQISDQGRVKSLQRVVKTGDRTRIVNERILVWGNKHNAHYNTVNLSKDGTSKSVKIHELIAAAFLNYDKTNGSIKIFHINKIISDNRLDNLKLVERIDNQYVDYTATI